MQRRKPFKVSRQSGVGLVEILVSLAIGLVTAIIVMQVMTAYQQQKRISSSGTDAETNASIALFTIQRQIEYAGYGLSMYSARSSPMTCGTINFDDDAKPETDEIKQDMSPIVLVDGGTTPGASDTIIVRTGGTSTAGIPVKIIDIPSPLPAAPAPVTISVENNLGCDKDQYVMIQGDNGCTLDKIKEIPKEIVPPATSETYSKTQITLMSGRKVLVGSTLSCLGNWGAHTFRVNNGNLEDKGVPIMANVVNLQAQYGISQTATSSVIDTWVDAKDSWAAPLLSLTNRNRIKAIRLAVVARSDQMEPSNVSSACSSLESAAPTGLCAWEGDNTNPAPKVDLSNDTNWQRYRYRVHETIIPLRNVIWSKDKL